MTDIRKSQNKQLIEDNIKALAFETWEKTIGELRDPVDVSEVKQLSAQVAKWAISGDKEVYESWQIELNFALARIARKKTAALAREYKEAFFRALPHIIGYVTLLLGGI